MHLPRLPKTWKRKHKIPPEEQNRQNRLRFWRSEKGGYSVCCLHSTWGRKPAVMWMRSIVTNESLAIYHIFQALSPFRQIWNDWRNITISVCVFCVAMCCIYSVWGITVSRKHQWLSWQGQLTVAKLTAVAKLMAVAKLTAAAKLTAVAKLTAGRQLLKPSRCGTRHETTPVSSVML